MPGDEPGLRRLWAAVFGPEKAFIDLFFRSVYAPGTAAVAEEDGRIVSAAYVVPFENARYIYAVGTHPDHRGHGFGKAVTLLAAGDGPAYLCPADPGLREWYIRSMGAAVVNRRPVYGLPEDLSPVTAGEYHARREELLSGVPHAVYTPAVLDLFALYGGFYADGKGGIWAMAEDQIMEALPCRFSEEPFILGLNGAPPLYWGLTLI